MTKVRLGIIGTSGWTDYMHLARLKDDPGVEVVAVSGRDTGRLAAVAGQYGIPHSFTDYRGLLGHPGLDGVIIATPDDQHLEMTLAAIGAGLSVLCEKPLANSVADARKMLGAAEARGVMHMVMFTWRWQAHFQHLKALLDEGTLGRIYRAQFSFITNFAHDGAYQWRLDPKRANGVIADLGSHMFDMARWMVGEVDSVSADLGTAVPRAQISGHEQKSGNDYAHVTMRFAGGAQGVVDVTNVSHDADRLVRHVVRIEAENGAVEVEHIFSGVQAGLAFFRFDGGDREVKGVEIAPVHYAGSDPKDFSGVYSTDAAGARAFARAIRDNIRPQPDFTDGLRAQELIDASIRSNAERRWVDIERR